MNKGSSNEWNKENEELLLFWPMIAIDWEEKQADCMNL